MYTPPSLVNSDDQQSDQLEDLALLQLASATHTTELQLHSETNFNAVSCVPLINASLELLCQQAEAKVAPALQLLWPAAASSTAQAHLLQLRIFLDRPPHL